MLVNFRGYLWNVLVQYQVLWKIHNAWFHFMVTHVHMFLSHNSKIGNGTFFCDPFLQPRLNRFKSNHLRWNGLIMAFKQANKLLLLLLLLFFKAIWILNRHSNERYVWAFRYKCIDYDSTAIDFTRASGLRTQLTYNLQDKKTNDRSRVQNPFHSMY